MLINKTVASIYKLVKRYCLPRMAIGSVVAFFAVSIAHTVHAIPAQAPLFQTNPVTPIMMLNLSRDHQLYFKVYDDYSDITNPTGGAKDGIPDTTYIPKYEYYGYFDSSKCYKYVTASGRFEPYDSADADHYCTSGGEEWSGNFLNWATMTRIDAVRKILYGGYRSTDTATETVLERAFLPHDAHSFAKFYDGSDIDKLTPFTVPELQADTEATGITICNTTADTDTATNMSQSLTSPPLLRVVRGNYSLWASNERWQCRFDGARNDNNSEGSGINAYDRAPSAGSADRLNSTGVTTGEYIARVKVCVPDLEESDCKQYPTAGSAKKPVGLFQQFGETNRINFGLMTGSYGRNKSGGVLRKTVGSMLAEINATTNGTFTGAAGAIKTLNALRIYGYNYADGTYNTGTNNDNCPGGISGFANGNCSNWGNPQSEIYLESLRYLAGSDATSAFASDDSGRIAGLNTIKWEAKPVTEANYCAPLNIIQFNASSSSFDDDELSGAGINLSDLSVWTNKIGNAAHENLSGDYFMGANSDNKDGICTGKNYTALSAVLGTCPDAPRLKGSYGIAGLSYFARQSDINTAITGKQNVRTFGVALAPAVPSIKIPVPGSDKKVEILPACKSNRTTTNVDGAIVTTAQREGNCAIVDFKIVSSDIDPANSVNTAKLYVNWESAEQGLDYDQDVWGTLDIEVDSGEARVTSRIFTVSTGASMGFGYVISGTEDDGWKVHSGLRDFIEAGTYCDAVDKCTCNATNASAACDDLAITPQQSYPIGDSSSGAKFLKTPLELAAKWGGYSAAFETAAVASAAKEKVTYDDAYLTNEIKNRDTSDSYFYATDPRTLKDSLESVMNDIAAGIGAASSVATVSARVSEGSFVYQAQFNSADWTGTLLGYTFESEVLDGKPELCSSTIKDSAGISTICEGRMQQSEVGRNIYFNKKGTLTAFSWSALDPDTQQAALKLDSESDSINAERRADWITGSDTYEESKKAAGSILRNRGEGDDRNLLGDIVNSNPVYVGSRNFRYNNLPGDAGATYREFLSDKVGSETAPGFAELVIVGANDGMVHAFNAKTMEEEFAFIPNGAFAKIAAITAPNYTLGASAHKYIVDGPLTYSDVFYKGEWRRIVVGTLGAGGRGVYALDVTDATPKLLFELSDADYPQMGYVLGKPIIAPMKNGRWTMIFGNGDSSESNSSLFVIDIEEPLSKTYSKVIDTGAGTGLSAPTLQVNSKGQALQVYAGDISGNLWRFNLYDLDTNDSNDVSNWTVAYKLFEAKDGANAQPITAAPTLGINTSKDYKTMVYFGTGKYYDDGDDVVGSVEHSFYAIADIGSTVSLSSLRKKTMNTSYSSKPKRKLDGDQNPDWSTQNGWVLNFDDSGAPGERVTTKAILLFDKLIFPTLIPSNHACKYGGNSWLMEVPAVGDKYVGVSILKEMTYADYLILGNLNATLSGDKGDIIKNSSLGIIETEDLLLPAPIEGRQSWRQLQ